MPPLSWATPRGLGAVFASSSVQLCLPVAGAGPASPLALGTSLGHWLSFHCLPLAKLALGAEIQLKRSDFSEVILIFHFKGSPFHACAPVWWPQTCPFGLWVWMRPLVSSFHPACGAQEPSTGPAWESLGNSKICTPPSPHVPGFWHLQMPCIFPYLILLHLSSHSQSTPAPLSSFISSKPALRTGTGLNFGGLLIPRAFLVRSYPPLPPPRARCLSSGLPLFL